jgi:ABC-type nitrate/sulfonate/bicarbonate transport system substrate-binding protein
MIMTYDITRRSVAALLLGAMLPLRAGRAEEPTVVRMSYDIPLFILPFFVAIDRKMFEANGITSVKVPGNSGMTNLMAVSGGATDIGSSGEISIAIAALTKVPVRIIASFNEVENMELACIKSIKTPGDLVGKRIAVAQGTPSHYYISLLAKKYGLQPTEINLVRLGPAEMISALTGGSIDGFVWQEPFLSKAVATDPNKFHRLAEPGLVTTNAVLIASDATIRQKRPAVLKSLRALDQACQFIAASPDEAIRIGADFSKMDPAVAGDAIKRMSIGLTLKVSELSKKLADQAQWAIAEGVARPDSVVPDYSAYLDGGLLAEIHQS